MSDGTSAPPDRTPEGRVTWLEFQVGSLADSVKKLSLRTHDLASLIQLENKQSGDIIKDIAYLSADVKELSSKLEARSKFPWQQWISGLGLLFALCMGIGAPFVNSIRGDIDKLDRDVASIRQSIVPRTEADERRKALSQIDEDLRKRIERLESKAPF